ncbi:hypothetical protein J4Q44_G00003190 [Coregonus suidteri]|uniref:TNRC6 PABC binding domain-containing protein n=1 Tax=Coregonus suidteri TaxID=861788 RepID=A0AAN8R7P9_9TELE
MEDKKRKKEDKRKREASQKVAEQKNKVPELTKPSSTQSPAAPSSASPSPGPTPSASPSPATAAAGGAPPQGGNNAKRPAVANGQPPAAGTQASQRYMPREVPPRFRCQQDHKVLLKRGQPPLSSMLLGGGTGPGGGGGDCPNATMAAASDSSPGYVGPAAPSLPLTSSSSSSIAASSTTSSNYANSTWGAGSGSLPSSQGREKVIVDGSDLEEWPSIAAGDGNGEGGGGASVMGSGSASSGEGGGGMPNSSASWKVGDPGSPSPTSSFSMPNECMLSGSVVWGSAASQGPVGGNAAPGTSLPSIPKASPLPVGPDGSLGGSGGIPGANFNPNANPSAWPALVQQDGAGAASSEGGPPSSLLQSLAGSLSPPGLGNPPLAVNQSTHQHQLHQMQSRDREHPSDGGWGGAALETGAGPKSEGTGGGADIDCGGGDNRGENLAASQTSSSSWGGQPFPAANSKTGASRTDGWEGGAAEGGGGSGWGYSAHGGSGGKSWGAGSGGELKTPVVSQGGGEGGERGSSVGDWGGNSGGMGGSGGGGNPGGEAGGVGGRSSSSSSSGGSNPPAASSSPTTSTTTTRAWDNQKGDGAAGGDTGEWGGGQGGRGGGGGNSSSGGGGNQHHGYGHHRYSHPPPPNPDVALQAMLSRSDLDPRVLSNTGWGQTQIRQNVAWDLEPGKGGSGSSASSKNAPPPMGPSSQYSTGSATTTDPMVPFPLPGSAPNLNSNPSLGTSGGSGEGWECGNNGSSSGSNSMPNQGPPPLGSNMRNPPGITQSGSMTTGVGMGGGGGLGPGQGKPTGGWGGQQAQTPQQPPSQQALEPGGGGGWGRQPGPQHQNQSSSGWTAGPIPSGPGGGEGPDSSGWEEPSPQFISRKMDIDDGTSAWGDPSQFNNKTVNLWEKNGAPAGQQPEMHGQGQGPGPPQQQGPPALQHPGPGRQPTGMGGRDINPGPGRQPTGMGGRDINPGPGRQPTGMGGRDISPGPGRQPTGMGGRDINPGPGPGKAPGMAPSSAWDGGSPSDPPVDNGTAAWGKPTETPTGWEDPGKTTSGWGNPSPNPIKSAGSKSMQEGGWGEGDQGSVAASRHSSWEEEEEGGGGVWSSAGSQGSSSSYNSGGWGQGHGGKKPNNKAPLKSGGGDSWMNPMNKQFSNMGLLGDDPSRRPLDLAPGPPQDKKMEGEMRGMGLNDYNGEMRKGGQRGVGGGGGMLYRSPGSKEMGPGDPGPCYDKGGHNMFGSSGGGLPQSRHQPGVPPINTSAGIRAQVPHQFLSPQVPGSMLKQMAPPSAGVGGVGGVGGVAGVGGGVFPPQLSPQHIAMLSGIYPPHIQFQLACQLLLQQQQNPQQLTSPQQLQQLLQNQRKFPQNLRQQADPQQLARIVAVLQQQRQQQQQGVGGGSKLSPSDLGGGGPKLPMADSLPHPGMGGSVDLHQKTQGYSGYGGGVNLSGLDMGGSVVGGPGGMKDVGGQQSRFKWMMEGHSPAPSPPESLHKNGPMSTPMRRGGSPYSQYGMMGGEGLGMPPQGDNWHRTPGNKMGSKPQGTSSWPPEFQPGVPWKGIQSIDPESDPYMTPGSMMGIPGPSSLNDTEHQLLRDNTEPNPSLNTLLPSPDAWPYSASDSPLNNAHNSAKYTEYKTSWPPEPIGHNKMWKTNRNQQSQQLPRPPPGLSNQKQASPSRGPWQARGWGSASGSQETRYGPGSAWSDGGTSRGSCWLVLCNLTPQIDGSTLRTICMQHGPLLTFHLGLTQGSALIRYSTPQEAAKAQSALHMCVLGNTTILAKFVSEEEVARYFAHSQAGGGGTSGGQGGSTGTGAVGANSSGERERDRTRGGGEGSAPGGGGGSSGPVSSGWQSLDSTGGCLDPNPTQGPGLSMFAQWSSNGAGVAGGVEPSRQVLWGGMGGGGYPSNSMWGSPAMEDRNQMGSPAALLPGDLLGGGADSI